MENFLQSFGNNFESKDGTNNGSSLQSAQLIGIYFSAHWCPPCRNFTPVLAEFYNKVNASGKVFEIVFASSDQDEMSFKNYLSTMPWIAIISSSVIRSLQTKFGVFGIPRLVILKPDGTVVVDNAKSEVTNKGLNAWLDWINKKDKLPVDPLVWTQITTSGIEVKAV